MIRTAYTVAFIACLGLVFPTPASARGLRGSLVGRVVVRDGGSLLAPNRPLIIFLKGPREVKTFKTRPDGTFVINNLSLGTWYLNVRSPGYELETEVSVVIYAARVNRVRPDPLVLRRAKDSAAHAPSPTAAGRQAR